MAQPTLFDIAREQLDACAGILNIDPGVHQILRSPKREVRVYLPVRMDDGAIEIFEGFRVQYNDARGPTKGGIRFHPNETIDTVRALAALMTWTCALLELPLGGAAGGVVCSPREMSLGELERLSRAYVRSIHDVIGPQKDIGAPDVYTNPQIMGWMMDEYTRIAGRSQLGVVSGKPIPLGGSLVRGDATARGGLYVLREAARELSLDLANATIAVQGYGNAGYYAASLSKRMFGSRIVAYSDSRGGIYNPDGIDPEAVLKHKARTGSVIGFSDSESVSNEELLEVDADVLIPAGLENVITGVNAPHIKAKIIVELANGPVTPDADDTLYENGTHILPDVLCGAGGVTVSYFEMVQNAYMYYWDEAMIHDRLEKKMTAAYQAVLDTSKKYKVNMRQAAYVLAVDRVVEAMRLRGWI